VILGYVLNRNSLMRLGGESLWRFL